ncbi:MAG: glycosyltransferase family 4 protein [Myxococcales bacterium]|nr:glycosyltransferase family 4 protein [Myxococcales bacterium]
MTDMDAVPTPVLLVSKPVTPPWNDSSKNLVKDLALAGEGFEYHVLTPRDTPFDASRAASRVVSHGVYGGAGEHTPGLLANLRVLLHLLRSARAPLWHFFFAPNPRTSSAARALITVRRRRAVQTICSRPRSFDGVERQLFGERVITVSRATREALLAAGVAPSRVLHIPPGIALPAARDAATRARTRARYGVPEGHDLLLYPGDYQFSRAADTALRALIALGPRPVTLVMACRIKQAASRAEEARLQAAAGAGGVAERVRFVNEVPDILDLVAASDLCLLPAESLYAKMDLPLVLIEAMALGVPIVVAEGTPSVELLDDDARVGLAVPPRDAGALAKAIGELLDAPQRRRLMGDAARRSAQRRYSIGEMARRHEALYRELLR